MNAKLSVNSSFNINESFEINSKAKSSVVTKVPGQPIPQINK